MNARWRWFLDRNRGKLLAILIFTMAWFFVDGFVLNRPLSNHSTVVYEGESEHECIFLEVGGPVDNHSFTVYRRDDITCGDAFDQAYPDSERK